MTKQYADRDIASEELNQLYIDHVLAMTSEGLDSKSDIAAELAYRDARIKFLEDLCITLEQDIACWKENVNSMENYIPTGE